MNEPLPINTALCSFGMSGRVFHAPLLYYSSAYHLYGAFERSGRDAEKLYPGCKHFSSLEEMLADDAIELVIVNTPNSSHYDYAKRALQAGKHVVVEKPFVPTVNEGQELQEVATFAGKKIAVYQNRRYDSDFLTMKKIVDEKHLGDIVEVEFHFDRYKQALSPKLHKETPGEASGIVYDLGSHIIDQALYLFGMPNAVFADIAIMRPISKVDDYFEILLYYPGKRVRLKGGYVVKQPVPSYQLHGTNGSFLKERGDVQEANLQAGLYNNGADWGTEPEALKGIVNANFNGEEKIERVPTEQGNYRLFYDQLAKAIRGKSNVPVSAEEGINVIRIIEAAFKSSASGEVIRL